MRRNEEIIKWKFNFQTQADWKEKSRHMQEKSDNAREACAVKLGLTVKEVKAADSAQAPPATRTEKVGNTEKNRTKFKHFSISVHFGMPSH